jgi:WD40 repeat protein
MRYPGHPVYVLSHEGTMLTELQLRKEIAAVPHEEKTGQGIATSVWSKDGFFITGGEDSAVRIWNIHSGSKKPNKQNSSHIERKSFG